MWLEKTRLIILKVKWKTWESRDIFSLYYYQRKGRASLNWAVALFQSGPCIRAPPKTCSWVHGKRLVNVKLGKSATEMYALLKEEYWDECLPHTQIFEWLMRTEKSSQTICAQDDLAPQKQTNFEKIGAMIWKKLTVKYLSCCRIRRNQKINC